MKEKKIPQETRVRIEFQRAMDRFLSLSPSEFGQVTFHFTCGPRLQTVQWDVKSDVEKRGSKAS